MKKPAPRRGSQAKSASRAKPIKAAVRSAGKSVREIDPDLVEALAGIVERHGLTEVEVEHDGLHIRVSRQATQTVAPTQIATVALAPAVGASALTAPPAEPLAPEHHPGVVKSPMVGTAYLRPSPDSGPFIEVGSTVKLGDKLLLIEAMKTFNEIVAPRAGTVVSLFIEDGQPVEFGEPLLTIE